MTIMNIFREAQQLALKESKRLHKHDVVRSCPFCGKNDLNIFDKPSKDGTVIWHKIVHGPHNECGISMMDSEKDRLIKRWNTRA